MSYNHKKWHNIRCPYFMYGSAGYLFTLIEYYEAINKYNWTKVNWCLDSLDQPFAYNYGFNNGIAGMLYVLVKLLNIPDLPESILLKIKNMVCQYKKMLVTHYHNDQKITGWPSDSQFDFTDDLDSGTLGIYLVIRELSKVEELCK